MYHETNNMKVKHFMQVFGQEVHTVPYLPSNEVQELRYELIREELAELLEGLMNGDLVEISDALTDILYVVYGAGHAFGIDLDACFRHVHASNMSKLGDDGRPLKRPDGKVMKGPNYWAPKLEEVIYPPR